MISKATLGSGRMRMEITVSYNEEIIGDLNEGSFCTVTGAGLGRFVKAIVGYNMSAVQRRVFFLSQFFFSMGVTSADVMEQIEEWVTPGIRESREKGQDLTRVVRKGSS